MKKNNSKKVSRRQILKGSAGSAMALSLRAAITGLPIHFLMTGDVGAETHPARTMIISSSSSGEPLNVCGPGSFDPNNNFAHPNADQIDPDDLVGIEVNGTPLDATYVQDSALLMLGQEQVRMAKCFEVLDASLLQHLVWFNYRTRAGIHPQFNSVIRSWGDIQNADGRGSEEIAAAIAQETAGLLGTRTSEPFVLGNGRFSSNGAPLANYSPTKVRALAQSVGQSAGGAENFAVLYDHFIDTTYRSVKDNGTAQQKRFFDMHASSKRQAADFGETLGQLLDEIVDDTIESQLKAAVVIAKMRLSPVVVTNYSFGHDNHSDRGLSIETRETLLMIRALDTYWKSANALGVVDETVFATIDVFGRDPEYKGGRGHHGDMTSGLIIGTHLQGGVIGGIDMSDGRAKSSGINSSNGSSADVDIPPHNTLNAYYKTLMQVAGVPAARRDVRIPKGISVASVG